MMRFEREPSEMLLELMRKDPRTLTAEDYYLMRAVIRMMVLADQNVFNAYQDKMIRFKLDRTVEEIVEAGYEDFPLPVEQICREGLRVLSDEDVREFGRNLPCLCAVRDSLLVDTPKEMMASEWREMIETSRAIVFRRWKELALKMI